MITGQQIEDYVYNAIKSLNLEISGKVYKRGTRPEKSTKEDCVVSFLTGSAGQLQTIETVVNIYVPDIKVANGQKLKDITRCKQIEEMLDAVPALLTSQNLYCEQRDIIATEQEPAINQHFVSLRLRFYHSTI